MKKANHGAIRHFEKVDLRLDAQFEDKACSAKEYCDTSRAMTVALHYLDKATDLETFKTALAAHRTGVSANAQQELKLA